MGLCPQTLREWVDTFARPASSTFEKLWQLGDVPEDWKRSNSPPIFKKNKRKISREYRLVSLISVPGKEPFLSTGRTQGLLGVVTTDLWRENEPKVSCNKLTGLVDKGVGTLHVLYLAFNKAFDTLSHVILAENLKKCIWYMGSEGVENQFKGWARLLCSVIKSLVEGKWLARLNWYLRNQ